MSEKVLFIFQSIMSRYGSCNHKLAGQGVIQVFTKLMPDQKSVLHTLICPAVGTFFRGTPVPDGDLVLVKFLYSSGVPSGQFVCRGSVVQDSGSVEYNLDTNQLKGRGKISATSRLMTGPTLDGVQVAGDVSATTVIPGTLVVMGEGFLMSFRYSGRPSAMRVVSVWKSPRVVFVRYWYGAESGFFTWDFEKSILKSLGPVTWTPASFS